jgi:hypothetical protein
MLTRMGHCIPLRKLKNIGLPVSMTFRSATGGLPGNYLDREKEKWPEWSPTLIGFKDSEEKLKRKDEEIRLADMIFVASRFTERSLLDFPGKRSPGQGDPLWIPSGIRKKGV